MALEPGLDVVMVGHPFKLGTHSSSAIWKGAMVASDSAGASERSVLLDAPGVPGMSRSPVYHRAIRSSQPFARPERYGYKTGAFGTVRPNKGDLVAIEKEVSLELLRVYAGATGDRALETLRLGRMFPINLVEDLLRRCERGHNPFPPTQ